MIGSKCLKVCVLLSCLVGQPAAAQESEEPGQLIPLEVQVVITTYQGQDVVSSLPYQLSVLAGLDGRYGPPAQMRMGAEVPIVAGVIGPNADQQLQSFNYRPTGTNIDCLANTRDGEQFALSITIEDTSVQADDQATPDILRAGGRPVFRTFESANSLVLRNGQSRQFTAAADRITGEVIRVDVTLTVVD